LHAANSAGALNGSAYNPPSMPLQAGTRVGPYEVLSSLGTGGMGEVWLATELRLRRNVALKLLPPT